MRTIVYWGLYWGPLILGNYQISLKVSQLLDELEEACQEDRLEPQIRLV